MGYSTLLVRFDPHSQSRSVSQRGPYIGQDGFDQLRRRSYPQTDVFLICFDVTSPASFENVREKWFPELSRHCPGVPCLIVGTQIDLRDDPEVKEKLQRQRQKPFTREDGEELAWELGAFKYVECSAKTQTGLEDVFDEVCSLALVLGSWPLSSGEILTVRPRLSWLHLNRLLRGRASAS